MRKGKCYWITGLSNSGKTTIGTALYYELKKNDENVIILDGDLMKQIASGSENAGYSSHDRMIRAKRYSLMTKLLVDQGFVVIVCVMALFDDIRKWNRKNIKGYIEIFLDVEEEVLRKRDKKGVYEKNIDMQLPKNPDLTIKNNGDLTVKEIVGRIKELKPIMSDDYDRDRLYWNDYYGSQNGRGIIPSSFAVAIEKRLSRESHILELGCGNGRDSLFFIEQGHRVVAIDGSDVAVEMLNSIAKGNDNSLFVCDDFIKCHAIYQMIYDCIYSRFTLHAITEEQEMELLNNVKKALSDEGIFCVEARSVHDDIYGKGIEVGRNSFIFENHYRRFVDAEEFRGKLERKGFEILLLEEGRGFSKTEFSDPVLIRCVARKGKNR